MSPFSWQCQNPCLLSLAFIVDWSVVSLNRRVVFDVPKNQTTSFFKETLLHFKLHNMIFLFSYRFRAGMKFKVSSCNSRYTQFSLKGYGLKGYFLSSTGFYEKIRVPSTGSETSKGLEKYWSFNYLFQTTKTKFLTRLKHSIYRYTFENCVFIYFSLNLSFSISSRANWPRVF